MRIGLKSTATYVSLPHRWRIHGQVKNPAKDRNGIDYP